jgi:PrcB C-terminal
MHFRVIEKGSYGPAEGRAPSIVVQGSVVTLNVGKRPTGGWSIEPLEVTGDEQLLTIKTKVSRPATGSIVTEAFTSAYVKIDVGVQPKAVRWIDEDGQLMAETK